MEKTGVEGVKNDTNIKTFQRKSHESMGNDVDTDRVTTKEEPNVLWVIVYCATN